MRTVKIIFCCLLILFAVVGVKAAIILTPLLVDSTLSWASDQYNALFVTTKIEKEFIKVEKEPDWGPGLSGKVGKAAARHGIPAAIMKGVIKAESNFDESNMAIAIADKWQTSGKSYKGPAERWKYAAYGLCQLLPAYTMDLCQYSSPEAIWGPAAIDSHLDCCAKRLKQDYEQAKGVNARARWAHALVFFYGAQADGYQEKVLNYAFNFALEKNS